MLKAEATLVKLICIVPIIPLWIYLVYNEIKQVKRAGPVNYLKAYWNIVDLINYLLTPLVILFSFEPFDLIEIEIVRVVASVASSFLVLKFYDWLRLFEKTAFFILLLE